MSCYDRRKNHTYHHLLKCYIDGIGRTDCPAKEADAATLQQRGQEMMRSIGQVVGRNGAWEIHMIRVDTLRPYRLVKQKLRTFSSRKIAEIVARYIAASECGQCAKKGGCAHASLTGDQPEWMNVCWN